MISSTVAENAFRHSAIRFLACIAALSVTGLALVLTNPNWWPVSVVTVGMIPFLYHFADPRGLVHSALAATSTVERLEARGYGVWRNVCIGDRVVPLLLVGSTGVFAISRVEAPRRFGIGQDRSLHQGGKDASRLLWDASRDAVAVKHRLRAVGLRTVPVRPVVAVTRARLPQGSMDLGQAVVVDVTEVSRYVLSSPICLSREQVARACGAFESEEPTERSRRGRR